MKTLHKTQRKAIRKMIVNPETTPATIDQAEVMAKEMGMTREEFFKQIGIEEAIPYNIFKKRQDIGFWGKTGRMFTFSYWKNRSSVDTDLHIANLVHMELNNGMHRTFIVSEHNNGFYYLNKRYVFDIKVRYFDLDYDMHGYDYHEGFALPFARHFPATDIKRTLEASDEMVGFEVAYAVNPSVLERFVNSAAIEMALNAGEIRQKLDRLWIFVLITMVLVCIIFLGGGFTLYKIYKAVVP